MVAVSDTRISVSTAFTGFDWRIREDDGMIWGGFFYCIDTPRLLHLLFITFHFPRPFSCVA